MDFSSSSEFEAFFPFLFIWCDASWLLEGPFLPEIVRDYRFWAFPVLSWSCLARHWLIAMFFKAGKMSYTKYICLHMSSLFGLWFAWHLTLTETFCSVVFRQVHFHDSFLLSWDPNPCMFRARCLEENKLKPMLAASILVYFYLQTWTYLWS